MTDHDIAHALLAVHHGAPPIAAAPIEDEAQAYRLQALVMAELGPIGGWKVGAPGPDAPPNCAPMPASGLFAAPHAFDSSHFTQREVESEICFRLAHDLPPRDTPYTHADILAAIASCHPGIEILQSRFAAPESVGALCLLADFIQTGAYVTGAPIDNWRSIDFPSLRITQTISGRPTITRTGNPAGDMIRLMVWLANTGAIWAGGLRAGQIVTCGSWTGKAAVPAGGEAAASFEGAKPVVIGFTPA
jgi:2-keto-4-pentenoate hydratase